MKRFNLVAPILILSFVQSTFGLTIQPYPKTSNERIVLSIVENDQKFLDLQVEIFDENEQITFNQRESFHKIDKMISNADGRQVAFALGTFTGALFLGPVLVLGYSGAHFAMDDDQRDGFGNFIFGDRELRRVSSMIKRTYDEYEDLIDGDSGHPAVNIEVEPKWGGASFSDMVKYFVAFFAYYYESEIYEKGKVVRHTCDDQSFNFLDAENSAHCTEGIFIEY